MVMGYFYYFLINIAILIEYRKQKNAQSPGGQAFIGELPAGLEPATPSLPWKCSTTELWKQKWLHR